MVYDSLLSEPPGYDITYVWNLKQKQTNEYNKKGADSQIQKTN